MKTASRQLLILRIIVLTPKDRDETIADLEKQKAESRKQ